MEENISNVTQFPGAKATDTLVPQVVKVVIGEGEDTQTYTIATFCLAKTIRTFTLMTELAAAAGISEIVGAVSGAVDGAEGAETAVVPGFIARALAVLPKALSNGTPALLRLLGLLVTPNAKLRKMDEDGEDIDGILFLKGRDISYDASNDQIVELVVKSVQVIGVETIIKQLPNLTKLLSGGKS